MLNKTWWLTIGVISASVVLSFILKFLFDPFFLPRLSITLSLIISIGASSGLLIFAFKPVKKQIIGLIISQEKYKEITNLLEKTKREIEEKNIMLRQKTETLTTLNRISKAMISTVDLNKVLGLISEAVQKDLNFDRIIIFLVDDSTLVPKNGTGINEAELRKLKISLKDKNNFIVKTVIEAKPNIISSIEDELLPANFTELYKNINSELLAAVPLLTKEKVTGLLLVDNIKSQRKIEEKDVRTLAIFTNQAGLAIENARLFEIEENFADELKKQIEIAKEELQHAQKELIKSERLSALGEMSAIVAHEVRNPMASIRASAQWIGEKIPKDDPNRKYTGYIIEESDRLERVVKDILAFSRESTPQVEPTDINKLIEDVLYFLQPEIESAQVRLLKHLKETISMIKIDPALIRQVLLNVIQNGLHFMANMERKELKVTTIQDVNNVVVEISDTGPGIPEENIKKIFDPFFTTKPSGTGLGLAVSNRIIESHKGRIEVESRLGHGATFKIILPG